MTTAAPFKEACPRCGGPLDCVWGPAQEEKKTWNQSILKLEASVTHYVLNANRCPKCGFAVVLDKIDTTAELSNLLKATQADTGARPGELGPLLSGRLTDTLDRDGRARSARGPYADGGGHQGGEGRSRQEPGGSERNAHGSAFRSPEDKSIGGQDPAPEVGSEKAQRDRGDSQKEDSDTRAPDVRRGSPPRSPSNS